MKYYRKNRGVITLSAAGSLAIMTLFILIGYVLTLCIITGVSAGSITLWLTSGIRKYPNHYMDTRDTG